MSGAREDLIKAFEHAAVLYRYTTRIETFFTTNDFFRKTALPKILFEAETQRQANAFLEAMQEQYGNDAQYKYIMDKVKKEKYVPLEFESPLKGSRIIGWIARMLDWIRSRELQALREEYEHALDLVCPFRCHG